MELLAPVDIACMQRLKLTELSLRVLGGSCMFPAA